MQSADQHEQKWASPDSQNCTQATEKAWRGTRNISTFRQRERGILVAKCPALLNGKVGIFWKEEFTGRKVEQRSAVRAGHVFKFIWDSELCRRSQLSVSKTRRRGGEGLGRRGLLIANQ